MKEKGKPTKGLNMTKIQKEEVKLGPMTAKRRALLFFGGCPFGTTSLLIQKQLISHAIALVLLSLTPKKWT